MLAPFRVMIHSKLLVPFAGRRHYGNAGVYELGRYAYLWSSSPYSAGSPDSQYLYLGAGGSVDMSYDFRAYAFSVRCFHDSYQTYTKA